MMQSIVEEYTLCQRLTGIKTGSGSCFNHSLKTCNGACIGEEPVEEYNARVLEVLEKYSYTNKNMLVIDRGRDIDEKSALLVEEGQFKGIGYFNLNYQLNNVDIIKSIITPMKSDRDAQHIIQSYLRKNNKVKIITLDTVE
jgi:DNA polymerase-3 subunit epsilon